MFYQEALPKFWLISCVDSLLTIGDRHWRKLATTFKKPNQQIHFRLHSNEYLFIWGACFCMGAYKHDLVVVIKMCGRIQGCFIFYGCLLSRLYDFTVCDSQLYCDVNSPKIEQSSSMKLAWN